MISLLYVSRSRILPVHRERMLDDIQAESLARNSQHDITGLLVAASAYFAQLLEGPG
ncbi:BLUF domain-containing protein, partial [Novosphingobium malaysiense]|uniref:BLUF domain-containing protein n=1 Tax=Novosphingobium malaysiense TaxID=1348853 RepID=UPI0018CE2FB5